ncbi:hypothetical protein SAMN05443247_06341 [Bradyrhizobium erythrophlei]|nr:hypothetical protein SAMN05443247_06341 [Bradyrhizobium erythrophlei]
MSHAIKLAITASIKVRFLAFEISSFTWRQKSLIFNWANAPLSLRTRVH